MKFWREGDAIVAEVFTEDEDGTEHHYRHALDLDLAVQLHRELGEAIGHDCLAASVANIREALARRGVDDG